ncbi:MAG TPA: hypothetical protein VH391_07415 [Solirubrobacterales bacterium]|jgi:hypothetical protein
MECLTISARLRSSATQTAGDPPGVDVAGHSEWVSVQAANGSDTGIDSISYTRHARFTGESTFAERGRLTVNDGEAALDFATVSDGTLGPSADPDVAHGSVMWRIEKGRGRFEGATGLITSNFLLRPASGEVDERQVAVVFLP